MAASHTLVKPQIHKFRRDYAVKQQEQVTSKHNSTPNLHFASHVAEMLQTT